MPYIKAEQRMKFDIWLRNTPVFDLPGELSYVITRLVQKYVMNGTSYLTFAVVVGVLVLTTVEYIRRVINPYEDNKITENGDVYS